MPQYIAYERGPLPLTVQWPIESDGPATLTVAGSVWSGTADTEIGVTVSIDGTALGSATIFSNGPSTHRAVVPATVAITLDADWPSPTTPPTYSVTLEPLNGATVSDSNDVFSVVLTV